MPAGHTGQRPMFPSGQNVRDNRSDFCQPARQKSPRGMSEATLLLNAIESGDAKAADQVLPLVYEELRRLAASKMANEAAGHTLQPTALVHEAWLRLVGDAKQQWDGRGHFFAAAAESMRRILIEKARRKHALKRGVDLERVNLD